MGSTQFGNFHNFCRDSTLPACNVRSTYNSHTNPYIQLGGYGFKGCSLTGITLSHGRHLSNLGSILLCGLAIVITAVLLWRADRKQAAVGRREFQLFLVGYIIVEICEIFTVGGFPLDRKVRLGFTAVHLGSIVATLWVLLLNGIVGFQILDDGTPLSVGLILLSGVALFIGTGYIALDTAFSYTSTFVPSLSGSNRNIALYVLYQLWPLICLVGFFLLETVLVLRVLGEKKPMQVYLMAAALLFAIGQIFQYVISTHICQGTHGKIDGALFETLFTLLSVVMIWVFWSSITEDDWPMPTSGESTYT
ncbi:putative export control protein CHS7-like protein [Usnea florida]